MTTINLTENGTKGFYLPPGQWSLDITGTVGGSTTIDLKTGGTEDGSGHVAVTDDDGTAIQWTNSSTPEPRAYFGNRYYSFVVASYSGSSDLVMQFRKTTGK